MAKRVRRRHRGAACAGLRRKQMIEPASATPVPGPMPEVLRQYTPVTAARLKNPEDGNWLMFRRTFDGWVTARSGRSRPPMWARLQPVWSFATGQIEGHEAPPVVNNGVHVRRHARQPLLALEAKNRQGAVAIQAPVPRDMTPLHPTSRGVGLWGDKVYFAAAEAVLVAIDVRTGKEAWTAKVDDYKKGYYLSLAPLVIDARCCSAYRAVNWAHAASSRPSMRRPARSCGRPIRCPRRASRAARPGPRAVTTINGAGASIWITGTYDPETNLLFWGTGNGGPWFRRSGVPATISSPARWSPSPAPGQIKGHFQYHPNDSWIGRSLAAADRRLPARRENREGLVNRRSQRLSLAARAHARQDQLRCRPAHVRQNVFKGLDPTTGRPTRRDTQAGHQQDAEFCPSLWGGKNWPPAAYSPQTRMLYIPANDNLCTQLTGEARNTSKASVSRASRKTC